MQERFQRNCLALGKAGQEILQKTKIAIVGVGGHGFNLALMLSHLGINLIVIDRDKVEQSNLNRLVSLGKKSVGKYKVDVLKQKIKDINPELEVQAISKVVEHEESLEVLKEADIIVGSSDSESCRISINNFSAQYLTPFLDMGCGIQANKEGKIESSGGQLRWVIPNATPCLICLNGIDTNRARIETLSKKELKGEIARGYVKGYDLKQPSLISLNMTMCSLAVTQILFYLTGLSEIQPYIYYDFLTQEITKLNTKKVDDCIVCSQDGRLGKGDTIPVIESIGKEKYPKAKK